MAFLKKVGYKSSWVRFVPMSVWEGVRVTGNYSSLLLWHFGLILMDALDDVAPPKRPVNKPLCITIQDVYKIGGASTIPIIRVKDGILKAGIMAKFVPSNVNVVAAIMSFEPHHKTLDQVAPWDNTGFHVKNIVVNTAKID